MNNKRLQVEFIESIRPVTEEHYDDMLGSVPLIRMVSNAFLVGEASDHIMIYDKTMNKVATPRYELYYTTPEARSNRFHYGGLATIAMFDMWTTAITQNNIIESPEDTIKRIKNN